MSSRPATDLDHVTADMAYTMATPGDAHVRIFPPSSGRGVEAPGTNRVAVPVYDCRAILDNITLDDAGFEVHRRPTTFSDFYDLARVRDSYYPEVVSILKNATGASDVFVFDHNVRSKPRSERGEAGVREPVDGAHNDYTVNSGPRRVREVLEQNNAMHLDGRRAALINLWRPILGPVQDHPLAICDARSAKLDDFVATKIDHFLEGDLHTPSHSGEIYSFRYNPDHRWYYVSNMQPDEVMLLKCYDSADDGRACFTGHTGFRNPACPPEFIPRESIEARTVVIFPEKRGS